MSRPRDDEFYVGYLPAAPVGVAARTKLAVLAVVIVAVALAGILAVGQRPFGSGAFEFGVSTTLTGVVQGGAHPVLLVPADSGDDGWKSYLLSRSGKHGADALLSGLDGQAVRMQGSLIYRDERTMLEVEDGTVEPLDAGEAAALLERPLPPRTALGRHTLIGEIVDSKCFLGVMKPGNLKPHRGCATRCISGGVPPVLLVRNSDGFATYYLLTGARDEPINKQVLPFVAEPVEIVGEIERRGDLLVLRAEPSAIRRIESRPAS